MACADKCYKPAKHVLARDGTRASEGTFSIMSARKQIMGFWHTRSYDMKKLTDPVSRFAKRNAQLGQVSCLMERLWLTQRCICWECLPADTMCVM